jgi:hypothetical protein
MLVRRQMWLGLLVALLFPQPGRLAVVDFVLAGGVEERRKRCRG